MAYAAQADIEGIYGAGFVSTISDLDNDGLTGEEEEVSAVAASLDAASAFIDAHLSARYPLPLQTVPDVLKHVCVDVAVYYFCNDHGRLTDEMRTRYEDAEKLLERIAEGKAGLGLAADPDGDGTVDNPPARRMYSITRQR